MSTPDTGSKWLWRLSRVLPHLGLFAALILVWEMLVRTGVITSIIVVTVSSVAAACTVPERLPPVPPPCLIRSLSPCTTRIASSGMPE